MAFSGLDIVSAITLFLLIYLSAVLVTSKKATSSSRILGTFFLLNALNISGGLLSLSDFVVQRPALAFWTIPLPLLFGPLIWFYCNDLLFRDFHFTRKSIWHFIPFAIFLVLIIVFYHFIPREEQLDFLGFIRLLTRDSYTWTLVTSLFYTHILIYLAFCWWRISLYREVLKMQFSSTETLNARWLLLLIAVFAFTTFIALINTITGFSGYAFIYEFSLIGLSLSLLSIATSVLYRSLTFPHFFSGIYYADLKPGDPGLSKKKISTIKSGLNDLMESEQLFRRAHLNLDDVSVRLEEPPEAVAHVLRSDLETSFFDYVNLHRVRLSQKMLQDQMLGSKSMMEIMYEVGFNSPASFNHIFKKHVRDTPENFRKTKGHVS